jgi:TetR/AcrR family transcriptional regulator, tetracycline repressor protein
MNADNKTTARHGGRRRGAPPADRRLDRQAVVTAARDLIAQDGYARFSLRVLASTLDVRPAALYNHVRDRDDLLDAVAEWLVAGFELPEDEGDWLSWVRQVARRMRERLREHPHLADVVLSRSAAGPARPALVRGFIERLVRAGVDPAIAHAGWHAVLDIVVGAASQERARGNDQSEVFDSTLQLVAAGLQSAASRPPDGAFVTLLHAHPTVWDG